MCGIVAIYNNELKFDKYMRSKSLSMSKKVRHRGPDWSGIYSSDHAILAHERLSIVDVQSGKQPLISSDENLILSINGEIYNHLDFRNDKTLSYDYKTKSDCEILLALYEEEGVYFLNKLNGIFAFALYDIENNEYFIARDHIGIIPLYMGWDTNGTFYVAS